MIQTTTGVRSSEPTAYDTGWVRTNNGSWLPRKREGQVGAATAAAVRGTHRVAEGRRNRTELKTARGRYCTTARRVPSLLAQSQNKPGRPNQGNKAKGGKAQALWTAGATREAALTPGRPAPTLKPF